MSTSTASAREVLRRSVVIPGDLFSDLEKLASRDGFSSVQTWLVLVRKGVVSGLLRLPGFAPSPPDRRPSQPRPSQPRRGIAPTPAASHIQAAKGLLLRSRRLPPRNAHADNDFVTNPAWMASRRRIASSLTVSLRHGP